MVTILLRISSENVPSVKRSPYALMTHYLDSDLYEKGTTFKNVGSQKMRNGSRKIFTMRNFTYCSHNTVRIIKYRVLRLAEHVA